MWSAPWGNISKHLPRLEEWDARWRWGKELEPATLHSCRHEEPKGADQPCCRQVDQLIQRARDKAEADLIRLREALERAAKKRSDSETEDDERLAACTEPPAESEDGGFVAAPAQPSDSCWTTSLAIRRV
jgi:hypothetical protein